MYIHAVYYDRGSLYGSVRVTVEHPSFERATSVEPLCVSVTIDEQNKRRMTLVRKIVEGGFLPKSRAREACLEAHRRTDSSLSVSRPRGSYGDQHEDVLKGRSCGSGLLSAHERTEPDKELELCAYGPRHCCVAAATTRRAPPMARGCLRLPSLSRSQPRSSVLHQ